MKVLRSKDIKELTELTDAMNLCDYHGIPVEGLETFEEIIKRLWLHYRLTKHGDLKERIQKAMQRTREEDQKRRKSLTKMFEELMLIIADKDDVKKAGLIKDLLKKEHTSDNLQEDCQEKVELLKSSECVILVAGETNAGKSSFLNLLLGKDYLPTHSCSCTSTITLLKYAPTAYAKIIYGGSSPREEIVEGIDEVGMPPLFDVVYMKGRERDQAHDIKEVQVYLPSEFLKCGIVLADSPGIGENEFLEQYLMDFIAQNEILGFIYIIMSDSAGGVQEDRLLTLLKMVINQQKESKTVLNFDPKAALFVANRFDAIPEDSRNKVQKHILTQLGKTWPEFDESMAVFFSTKKALNDICAHPAYINDQYKHLLDGMSSLFSRAMDRRIRSSYRWMETVLKRIAHFLKTTVTRLGWTQRENAEKSSKHRKRLKRLQTHSDTVIAELMLDMDGKCGELVKEIKNYLVTPQAQFLLCSTWGEDEIPKIDGIEDPTHWAWVKQRVDEAFYDRLCNALEDYNDEKCKVTTIEAEILDRIKASLGILQEEIAEVENEISSTKKSSSSDESSGSDRFGGSRKLSLTTAMRNGSMIEFPSRYGLKLQHRVSKNPIRRLFSRSSSDFLRNPQQWSKERAKKLLTRLVKDEKPRGQTKGILTALIEQLLQRPRDVLDKIRSKIPLIIETDLALLQEIEDHIIKQSRNCVHYEQTMVQIEMLKNSLMNYGEGYIFVHDFKTNEVKLLQENPMGGSLAQTFRFSELVVGESRTKTKMTSVLQGLWTVVRQGILHREDQENPISIKMYMPSSGVTQTFQEVAKLRCLLYEDVSVARFLGIHHTEAINPAYIFEGHFLSAESYFLSCSDPGRHYKRVFSQTAKGLQYLHCKGMVHMELSPSTLTVNEEGEVRLTGASVPRHATLPLDPEQPVSNFVYLSPEVLHRELYVASADVYGFGLLLFEIVGQTKAFNEQKTYSFNDFVDKLNPVNMLGLNNDANECLSHDIINLVKQCVELYESQRPNMDGIIEILDGIQDNFRSNHDSTMRRSYRHTPGQVFRMARDH